MAEDKKPDPGKQQPLRESVDYGEAPQKTRVTNDRTISVSQRVPITPAPPKPPDKDKK